MNVFYSSSPAWGILIQIFKRRVIDSDIRQYWALMDSEPTAWPLLAAVLGIPRVLCLWIRPLRQPLLFQVGPMNLYKKHPLRKLVRNAESQAPLQTCWSESILTRSPGDSCAQEHCWRLGTYGPLGLPTISQPGVAGCAGFGIARETNNKQWNTQCIAWWEELGREVSQERVIYIFY